MVGHDIRNPLQAIIGDLYLAKSELVDLPKSGTKDSLQESLEAVEKSVDYINKIVADLQDYSKPITPITKETDVEATVQEMLKKNGLPKNITISRSLNPDSKIIVTDPDLLRRILGNLISNAVQAMPDGGKLTITSHRKEDDVVITVQDTGIGIPEHIKPKLFTPLFTTKSKGQGFGLAVVKRMTEALGGTVTFESQQGKGTKFIVRLPPRKNNINPSLA
jgi:signal transduction histidine kinase